MLWQDSSGSVASGLWRVQLRAKQSFYIYTEGQGTCHLHNPTHAEHSHIWWWYRPRACRGSGGSPRAAPPPPPSPWCSPPPPASPPPAAAATWCSGHLTITSQLELVSTVSSILCMYLECRMMEHAHHKQFLHCCSSACGHTTGQFRQMTGGLWPQKLHIHTQSPLASLC